MHYFSAHILFPSLKCLIASASDVIHNSRSQERYAAAYTSTWNVFATFRERLADSFALCLCCDSLV